MTLNAVNLISNRNSSSTLAPSLSQVTIALCPLHRGGEEASLHPMPTWSFCQGKEFSFCVTRAWSSRCLDGFGVARFFQRTMQDGHSEQEKPRMSEMFASSRITESSQVQFICKCNLFLTETEENSPKQKPQPLVLPNISLYLSYWIGRLSVTHKQHISPFQKQHTHCSIPATGQLVLHCTLAVRSGLGKITTL